MTNSWLAGACCAAFAACAPAPPSVEPPLVANGIELKRRSISKEFKFPTRPTVLSETSFDVQSLPLLTPIVGEERSVHFEIPRVSPQTKATLDRNLVAELQIGSEFRAYAAPASSAPLPYRPSPAGVPASRRSIACPKIAPTEVWIRGFHIGQWHADDMVFASYHGATKADGNCNGNASAIASVTARSLVPGLFYAFRECVNNCLKDGDPAREEQLSIVGPPSRWVTSTTDVQSQARPHVGTFTIASVSIKRGGTASILMHVSATDLAFFLGLMADPPARSMELIARAPGEVLAFMAEVVWLEGSDHADGTAYLAKATEGADTLVE